MPLRACAGAIERVEPAMARHACSVFYGLRISRLLVTSDKEDETGRWQVRCDCGAELRVEPETLLNGGKTRCASRAHAKVPPEEAKIRKAYHDYRNRARSKGCLFAVPYLGFKEIITWHCAYCGSPAPNGMDQVLAGEGYDIGNVVACCWKCNRAKSGMTQKEFIAWIKKIAENMHTSIWGSAHPVSKLLAEIEEQREQAKLPVHLHMLDELDKKSG